MNRIAVLVLLLVLPAVPAFSRTFDLDSITVSSTRSNDTLGAINKGVSVITAQDIASSPAKTLVELLGTQAGINSVYDGNIKNSQITIHGSGETSSSNILLLIDGRRTNQIDLSGVDWAQIDLNSIDHVEIIKGAGTVLYGDNANAGVINIITKKGAKDAKTSVSLFSEFSRYQTQKYGLGLNGGTRLLDYQFNYSHEDSTGYRANSDYWANDFNTHLGFDPTDVFGIDFAQGYHLDRYQSPGALFLTDVQAIGRRGVKSSHRDDRSWTSDAHFDVTPHLKFSSGTSDGEFSIFTSARKRNAKSFSTGSPLYETAYLTESYEFQPKLIVSTPLSDRLGNKVTGGYDEFYAKSRRRSGNLAPGQDLTYVTKSTHEVYLLDELVLDEKWLANLGMRGAWAQYVFDQKTAVAAKSKRSSTTEGYEGGLGYKYNANSRVYVNYARSYRLPNTDEFYQNIYTSFGGGGGLNADLRRQLGHHYSWGVRDNTFKDTLLGLNFFVEQYKDEVYLDYVSFNLVNTNYNGRTRHYGLDAEISKAFFDQRVEPYFNLTLQDAKFVKGKYAGNKMTYVPNEMANLGLILRPINHVSTTLAVGQVGKRFAITDTSNTHAKLKPYTTLNWQALYSLENIEFWLNISNMLDSKYFATGTYSPFSDDIGYYPAPGRNVTAGVKLKF